MHLRILQCLLVLMALATQAHASELRMSTAEVEANAPVDMAGHDTLTIYGEQNHDLLDLIDLSLASGTIRFESLDLANSGAINSVLTVNAGSELVFDGVHTLNSNISVFAAGGQVKIRNSVLGAVNSPLYISHPLSVVEIENSAICRAFTGIQITAGQLILNSTLFLTNDRAIEILGGQVTGLEGLSFQGCKEGVWVENSADTLSFTRCDFSGARTALLCNLSGTAIQLDQCYIDDPGKVFGSCSSSEPVGDPWRPMEKPLKSVVIVSEDIVDIPLTIFPSVYTDGGFPYLPSKFTVYSSLNPYDFTGSVHWDSATPEILIEMELSNQRFFRVTTSIGEWIEQ